MRLPSPPNAALSGPTISCRAKSTLAPFLYQTATIQRWIPRRTLSTTPRTRSDIPFGSANGIDYEREAPAPSSISSKEARILSLLQDPTYDPTSVLQKEKRRGKARLGLKASVAKDVVQARRVSSASDKQVTPRSAAVKTKGAAIPAERAGRPGHQSNSKSHHSQGNNEEAATENEKSNKPKHGVKKVAKISVKSKSGRGPVTKKSILRASQGEPLTAEAVQERAEKNIATVSKLFHEAESDSQMSHYLQLCGFERAKALYPCSSNEEKAERPLKPFKGKLKKLKEELKAKQAASLIRREHPHLTQAPRPVFAKTYPQMLVLFLRHLRERFRSSQEAFNLLPELKACGRESYVLGASTALYNELILANWEKYSNFSRINELLLEMENAGLDVDYETLDVLNRIKVQGEKILKGERGQILQQVWQLERIAGSWQEVVLWIPRVKEKLEAEALRRVREMEDARELEEWTREQAESPGDEQDHEALNRPLAAAAG